ncbi:MAG TPA: L,D-transpeptidase family protein, partial [Mycobacteriales bacterium]|nr:L,D-transpeptidase family protein [Mycobacteriales bacterium]
PSATAVVAKPDVSRGPGSAPGHSLVDRLIGVHDARQVIAVTTRRYGSTHATVRAFARRSSGWVQVAGPWSAWIGRRGFAPPHRKREGDGRTPTGSYHFSFFFGVDPNPGVRFRWRHAGRFDYWDDDSASPRYNEWVDTRRHSAGRDPEPLHVRPSYEDVAAIAYNQARTPHRGSAIFLHVTHLSATSGCVALPRPKLLTLLRWLRPGARPRIIMGRTATVTR